MKDKKSKKSSENTIYDIDDLLPKHKRFVDEYLIDFNATQAAKRAGYSQKTAHVQGTVLLKDPRIAHALEKRKEMLEDKALVTVEYVIEHLRENVGRCMQKKPVMIYNNVEKRMEQKIDENTGEGVWQFDSNGANKALELLGRYLRMYTDKVEMEVNDNLADKLKAARERVKTKK